MKELLKRLTLPVGTTIILSSCLLLAWHLYRTVYTPLFNEPALISKDQDYAISQTKLDAVLNALSEKTKQSTTLTITRNPFARSTEE